MLRLQDTVCDIVDRHGVILRRDHPELAGSIDRLVRTGRLATTLPGVYADSARCREWEIRLASVVARLPDAVAVGTTAARLSYWPTIRASEVEVAMRDRCEPRTGFVFHRRMVPAELVCERGGILMTTPALTALDLCASIGGDGIDRALLARAATLADLHDAIELTRKRRGNGQRRALLLDSRDEPWSAAERLFHRLLRDAGITGWRSNLPVTIDGRRYYLDVAFARLRLAVEIDGRLHETEREVFESDRSRQNALVLDGWTVLRFTWRMLTEQPEAVIAAVCSALGQSR